MNEDKFENTNEEPKISELEEMLRVFREKHGEEELLSEVLKERERGDISGTVSYIDNSILNKNGEQSFTYSDQTPSQVLPTIANTLSEQPEGAKKAKRKRPFFKSRIMKYIATFAVLIGLIYLLFNLPTFYARLTWSDQTTTTKIVRLENTVQKPSADSAKLNPGETIPLESRIVIPKIKVDAPIQFPDTNKEADIQKGLEEGVVHYPGTAEPGKVGNSFITGHSSNYWWAPGSYKYIFVLLDKLEPGDKVTTYHDGKKYVYTVRKKTVVDPTETSVLLPTNTPTMTLMTCTPPGTSWKRLIIKMDLTDPVYQAPKKVVTQQIVQVPADKQERSWLSKLVSFFIPN